MAGISATGVIASDPNNNPAATVAITVTASVFTYTNTSGFRQTVHVIGGTLSLVTITRPGSTALTIATAAGNIFYDLNIGDQMAVTYTVAPTMTAVPR